MLAAWALQSLAQSYMGNGDIDTKLSKEGLSKASKYAKDAYKYACQAVGADSEQVNSDCTCFALYLKVQHFRVYGHFNKNDLHVITISYYIIKY
jgi:hypothetical protein